jgi:hypothetical protein
MNKIQSFFNALANKIASRETFIFEGGGNRQAFIDSRRFLFAQTIKSEYKVDGQLTNFFEIAKHTILSGHPLKDIKELQQELEQKKQAAWKFCQTGELAKPKR